MDEERRSGYEGWLDEIAGHRVKTLPLFLAWVGLVGAGCGIAYLLGARSEGPFNTVARARSEGPFNTVARARSEGPFNTVAAVVSLPYWLWAVPRYLRRRRP